MYENKIIVRGEAALILAIIVNSMGGIADAPVRIGNIRMRFRRLFRKYRLEHGHIFFRDFW